MSPNGSYKKREGEKEFLRSCGVTEAWLQAGVRLPHLPPVLSPPPYVALTSGPSTGMARPCAAGHSRQQAVSAPQERAWNSLSTKCPGFLVCKTLCCVSVCVPRALTEVHGGI